MYQEFYLIPAYQCMRFGPSIKFHSIAYNINAHNLHAMAWIANAHLVITLNIKN